MPTRQRILACMTYCRLALLALPAMAMQAGAVELSGAIRSSTGALPPSIDVMADRAGTLPAIAGTIRNGRYHIDLPSPGMYRLRLQAKGWEAEPKIIFDPRTAGALDIVIYPQQVPEPELAQELIRMGEQDQEWRKQMPKAPNKEYIERWHADDLRREERLSQIISEKGWPKMSQVGHQAAGAAWLIAQHGSPDFLKRCLVLMKAAAEQHEITPRKLALSIDRVLVHDNEKQIYGSQFRIEADGRSVPYPIADPDRLDERRFSMGMEPFDEYRKHFEK